VASYQIWKKKKSIILLYFWLPTGTHHKNLAICIFFSLQNLANLHFVLNSKSFRQVENQNFQVEIWWNIAQKKKGGRIWNT
jgi:hypothetical protein